MNCPVCKQALQNSSLDETLAAKTCSQCGGSWLQPEDYKAWRDRLGSEETHTVSPPVSGSAERGGAKFCPQCAYVLIKHKVGHDLSFSIDRCGHCGGIWLDGNEWSLLKDKNLHAQIMSVFSEDWQSKVRREEHERALQDIWAEQFGKDDLAQLEKLKLWIDSHPKREEMYAYLLAERKKQPALR